MSRRRWLLAGGLAIALSVAVARYWRSVPGDPRSQLVRASAALDARMVEPRLVGFPYRPWKGADKASQAEGGAIRLRAAAGEVLRSTAADDHAAGVANLIAGVPNAAEQRLSAAAELHADDASLWSDLAAARYTASIRADDPRQLVAALSAADCALRVRPIPEAAFNRGLILERLGLRDVAAKQYAAYAKADPSSAWALEAQQRAERLRTSTVAVAWSNTLPHLKKAADEHDQRRIEAIVRQFTQEAESWSETVFLTEWGAATLRGDQMAADASLRIATATGDAVANLNGDTLLRDAASAIRISSSRTTLASAYLDYDTARKLYRDRVVTQAQPLFAASASKFTRGGSPMQWVARYYLVSCLLSLNELPAALTELSHLLRVVPQAYGDLRARLLWNLGLIYGRNGKQFEALKAEEESASMFQRLGEQANAITMRGQVATSEAVLGRSVEAWRTRRELFQAISLRGDTRELQTALDVAARTETLANAWQNAYSLLTLAADDLLRINPQISVSTLIWRALAAQRIGLGRTSIAKHIAEARRATTGIRDPLLRQTADADVTFAEAVVIRSSDPARSAAMLDRYIQSTKASSRTFLLPEALLERALAARQLGDRDHARACLQDAATILKTRQGGRPLDEYRDAYFTTADSVARELCSTLLQEQDVAGALHAIDDNRSEAYGVSGFDPRSIPPDTLLLEFVVFDDRIAIFTQTREHLAHFDIKESSKTVARVCAAQESGLACTNLLLASVMPSLQKARNVVIVPDPGLRDVRFAAMRLPGWNRFLIEQATITIAPSAAVAFHQAAERTPERPLGRIVLVGDPRPDPRRFDSLPPLTESAWEIAMLAARHPGALVLTRANATPSRVLSALDSAGVLYVAAHAFTLADPRQSQIVLSPDETGDGLLYLRDIERRHLKQLELVVLTGCRTGSTSVRSSAVGSLALSFVAIGAMHTIGTSADLDDAVALEFSSRLDKELNAAPSVAAALRTVQLGMMTSKDTRWNDPAVWGSFELYGAAPQSAVKQ